MLFAGSLLKARFMDATPAARSSRSVLRSETDYSAIELLKPPTKNVRTSSNSKCCTSRRSAVVARQCPLAKVCSWSQNRPNNHARLQVANVGAELRYRAR